MNKNVITDIFIKEDVSLITLFNVPNKASILSDVFSAFSEKEINIDIISQTAPYKNLTNISFTIQNDTQIIEIEAIAKIKNRIDNLRTEINMNNCKITIYGEKMKEMHGVAANLFKILSEADIEVKLITTSEIEISILVDGHISNKAVETLKSYFGL